MRLNSIKMSGFKSFVDPTLLLFPSSMVGIVGPNGCGKSNIIDAVRWVMGESSKHIRGDTMEDIIFNGSSTRKPVGQASIELIFDNSDGKLGGEYSAYTEISIRRQVTRDGQSRYFLNGTKCRRKDIVSLFLGTGLGPHSYAIVEQGMISRLIDAKPDELRVYLEEAAGISKYKERRRETENRIRHTRENLSRLNDIIGETNKRIGHLQRQARDAERFKVLKTEERQIEAELLALRWQAHQSETQQRGRAVEYKRTEIEKVTAEMRAVETEIEKLRQQHIMDEERLNDVQSGYYKLDGEISRIEQSIQHAKELSGRYGKDLQQIQWELAQAEQVLNDEQAKESGLEANIIKTQTELVAARERLHADARKLGDAEAEIAAWQNVWQGWTAKIVQPTKAIEVAASRIKDLERYLKQLAERKEKLSGDLQQCDAKQASSIQSGNLLVSRIDETAALLKTISPEIVVLTEKISTGRNTLQKLDLQLEQARKNLQSMQARLTSLQTLQKIVLSHESEDVDKWLERQGLDSASRLMDEIKTESGWETAVETVLGDYLGAVCVENLALVVGSINQIETGRLTVLGQTASDQYTDIGGTLASKVRTSFDLTTLLGRVLVAQDIEDACKMRERLNPGQSVITREGVWMAPNWLRLSRIAADKGNILRRKHEISALEKQVVTQREQVDQLADELKTCQRELYDSEHEKDRIQDRFTEEQKQYAQTKAEMKGCENEQEHLSRQRQHLQDEIQEIDPQIKQAREELQREAAAKKQAEAMLAEYKDEKKALLEKRDSNSLYLGNVRSKEEKQRESTHQLELNLKSFQSSLQATRDSLKRVQEQTQQLQQRSESMQTTMQKESVPLKELNTQLEDLVNRRVAIERSLVDARNAVQHTEDLVRAKQGNTDDARHRIEALREQLEEVQSAWQEANVRSTTIEEQLAKEYDLLPEPLLQQLPEDATPEEWGERIQVLKRKIDRLGAINLAAIDEYQEHSERKKYLDSQYKDLTDSLETLENAIHKIDKETKDRFKDTFERVNQRLRDIYPRLFHGGKAFLEMTGNDLLTTGVSIMAQLPGKRLTSIHLLSGGEKALTAVALIFSLFELNPAPFCLLDEVDAPLDDVNVIRYCQLLKDMSDRVQFIYITHNKSTMEYAGQLLGITMNEPGVSRIVSVDVDAAAEMATAS